VAAVGVVERAGRFESSNEEAVMTEHWRTFLDSDVVRFVDLLGKGDITLRIKTIKKGKITGTAGKATSKAMITFEGAEKPLGAGTAILSVIGQLYGNDTRQWPGKLVTLYADPSVKFGGEQVGGIRVRPSVPKEPKS
jgi:hypothetical protein